MIVFGGKVVMAVSLIAIVEIILIAELLVPLVSSTVSIVVGG